MKKKVLITGATGLIGRHILPLINSSEFEIYSIGRTKPLLDSLKNHIELDLLKETIEFSKIFEKIQPTHLLHMAWTTEHGIFYNTLENYIWLESSLKLIQSFIKMGGKRIVIAGTCVEADNFAGNIPERLLSSAPKSLYGKAKNQLKLNAFELSHKHNVEIAWGRIFYIYGPYQNKNKLIPSVIEKLNQNEHIFINSSTALLDYLHVYDVAKAFILLLNSHAVGEFNISSGKGVSVEKITGLIQNFYEKKSLFFNTADNFGSNTNVIGESERLKLELGWKIAFDIEDGIRHMVDWSKKNLVL